MGIAGVPHGYYILVGTAGVTYGTAHSHRYFECASGVLRIFTLLQMYLRIQTRLCGVSAHTLYMVRVK